MNCTGKRCIMQHDKVDPATCQCVSYCPQATPPKRNADRIREKSDEELAEADLEYYFDTGIDGAFFRYLPRLAGTPSVDWPDDFTERISYTSLTHSTADVTPAGSTNMFVRLREEGVVKHVGITWKKQDHLARKDRAKQSRRSVRNTE